MGAAFFYIIFNPAASSGMSVNIFKKVRARLDNEHIPYEIKVSRYAGHAVQLARQIGSFGKQENAVLMVIGGDGTLNQAICGLRKTRQKDMPVAYIPAGSGNDFARGIKMAQDPMKALDQVLAADKPLRLDIGQYTEATRDESGIFVNNIGVGFDGSVIAATNRSRYKRVLNRVHLGSLSYVAGVVRVFFSRKPFPVAVTVDGQRTLIQRAFLVTTTNHPYFGGGIKILPIATPDDGKLDLIVVEQLNIPYFFFLLVQMLRNKHLKYKAVHHFASPHIHLETTSLEFGQMDGEEMGSRPFELDFTVTQQNFWIKREMDK
ncbi:diacylglycerol/lipid kinase family protein [Lacticaseibacillus mingshuiensis]|uniref:diacylglycerol/lipid kinase family protein n=1 Tax=Lacticaseibacillus mingshuiensis TaxID=2799574 RepID=UPI0019511ED9|nr:diacylglycerol kinase family protein [Lacticaseibacillus mingshuiensis]